MLITGDAKVRNLFPKVKPADRFVTELLNDGSIRIARVNTAILRANADRIATEYVSCVEKQLVAKGYEVYFTKLSIGQTACLILKSNKLIYSGYSKCNMVENVPNNAIGEALSIWRAISGTPFECKLPEIVWNYAFNF